MKASLTWLVVASLLVIQTPTRSQDRIGRYFLLDTIVRFGDYSSPNVYKMLTTSENAVWLPSLQSDGSLHISGYSFNGIKRNPITISFDRVIDSAAILRQQYFKSVSFIGHRIAVLGAKELILLNLDSSQSCTSKRRYELSVNFDNCQIINDSLVALWIWRYCGAKPLSLCAMTGTLNLRTGHLDTIQTPFLEGLIMAYDGPFRVITTVKGRMYAADPVSGDVWSRSLIDPTSTWRQVVSGSLRQHDSTVIRNPRFESTIVNPGPLIERMHEIDKQNGERVIGVFGVSDSVLVIQRTTYETSRKGIRRYDFYVDGVDTVRPIAIDVIEDYSIDDTPCTRDNYPVLMSGKFLRTMGDRLIFLTIGLPMEECCDGKRPRKQFGECYVDKLEDIDPMPLVLMSYRFRTQR